ncbi:MAG TPA: hypothetical protein VJZ91_10835 [Blastocatellia bacterium]|nr:hypothetical protein [Blastocatellia bacterium]
MRKVSIILLFALLLAAFDARAQKRKKKPARSPQSPVAAQVAKAKEDVITAAQAYKESLAKLLVFQEGDVKTAAETVETRRALVEQQIVSKRELEESERQLAAARAKVAETRRQMGEADSLIAEAKAEAQLAKLPPPRVGSTVTSGVLIRYNGPAHWALSDAAKVQSYFLGQFHHALPVSAFGQTAVHTQLGFDHSNSLDVAVHPDSAEGRALMSYLRAQGIPFIAFRQAVAGSATGAHIHIGYPSHRVR